MEKCVQYELPEPQASKDPFNKPLTEPKKSEQDKNSNECKVSEFEMKTRNNKTLVKSNTSKEFVSIKIPVNKMQNRSKTDPMEVQKESEKVTKTNKRGIFGKVFHAFGGFFTEVKYLWKKEELVDCLDANGNHVKRPKKKVTLRNHKSQRSPQFKEFDIKAKEQIYENASKGINYGVLFI